MDFSILHMTAAKLAMLVLLTLTLACGVKVDERQDAAAAGGARHELAATLSGPFAAQVTSDAFSCDRLAKGDELDVDLTVTEGPEAGLRLNVRAAGELAAGDALTPDNSDHERFFELTLRTPQGATYRYGSQAYGTGSARGALTVTRRSEFITAARLWADGVEAIGAAPGSVPLAARVTFQCARWR